MADVFLAEDEALSRKVALKLLYGRFAADPDFVERFRREAQAAAGLQHPNVVSVYNQLHGKGFEILGISLDNAQSLKNIAPVTKDKGMTWDQVADGKYWDAAVAKLYGIQSIPAAFIVDGDTGIILSEGEAIRGENLLPAVQKALGAKSPK